MISLNRALDVLLPLFIILSSFFITVQDVENFGLSCRSEKLIGYKLGTCGLTRSIISISHLDFNSAINFNPFGIMFYTILVFRIVSLMFKKWLTLSDELFLLLAYSIVFLTFFNFALQIYNFLTN
jgi:hypothetical protein